MELAKKFANPQIPGIPYRAYPAKRVLGVPQRAYGYLTDGVYERHGIDKLQTSNVDVCVAVTGHNDKGAFLAHLDSLVEKEFPRAMDILVKILGNKFHFNIFTSPFCQEDLKDCHENQNYVPKLIKLLKKYAIDIIEYKKGMLAICIGITRSGELFHPKNHVEDDTLYGEENNLFSGAMPDQVKYRLHLGCINEMKNKT